jgi:hypothetical protein
MAGQKRVSKIPQQANNIIAAEAQDYAKKADI